jgi:hypothetical protein
MHLLKSNIMATDHKNESHQSRIDHTIESPLDRRSTWTNAITSNVNNNEKNYIESQLFRFTSNYRRKKHRKPLDRTTLDRNMKQRHLIVFWSTVVRSNGFRSNGFSMKWLSLLFTFDETAFELLDSIFWIQSICFRSCGMEPSQYNSSYFSGPAFFVSSTAN